MKEKQHSSLRIIAIVWLIVISGNALAAGFSFMAEPSGKDIGIPLSYLQYSPFENYFIPGLVLFTTIGIPGMATAFLSIKKYRYWAQLVFLQGCILLGWIIIQMLMVRDVAWLHVACGISGLVWMLIGAKIQKEKETFCKT